jgi:hypothetical protein
MARSVRISVRSFVASAALLLALTSHGSIARAEGPGDRAIAEGLFDEGRKLLDEGKLEEACAKLEASNRMDPAVGTLLNLGDCNEKRGRLATAWSNFRAAASLANTRLDPTRAEFARKRAEALQPRLSTLTITVAAPEPGFQVKRDGVVVDEAAWGTPLPIDSGSHVIEAQAPGKKTWSGKITVADGQVSSASLKIEPLVVDSTQPSTTPGASQQNGGESSPDVLRTLGFIGIGLGALTIGAGTYFALHAKSLWDDGASHCNAANQCDDTGFTLNADARRNGDVATVMISAGVVFAVAGAAAILFGPKRASSASPAASTTPAPVSTGFSLSGTGGRFVFHGP